MQAMAQAAGGSGLQRNKLSVWVSRRKVEKETGKLVVCGKLF